MGCESVREVPKTSAEYPHTAGDKENKVTSGARPQKVPEVKQELWNWRARNKGVTQPGRREQTAGQNRVLQFYNVV